MVSLKVPASHAEPVLASRRPREAAVADGRASAIEPPRGRPSHGGAISLGHAFASATWRSKRQARGAGWGEGNFPGCKPLKTNETELESPQIPPRPREPERCRRPPGLPAGSRDVTSVLGAVRRKSARRRMRGGEIFQSATH